MRNIISHTVKSLLRKFNILYKSPNKLKIKHQLKPVKKQDG